MLLKNIDNQFPIEFKSPSSIIEKENYKDKYDQLATNHLKQEVLHEIKHYISRLQQDNKTELYE